MSQPMQRVGSEVEGTIWITWERQRRSIELANAVGAKLFVLAESSSVISSRLLRYVWLSFKTFRVLLRESPSVVFAQNPSIFLAALLSTVKDVFGFKLIVDRHSNFKFDKTKGLKWKTFHLFSRYTIRRADLTIVTNEYLAGVVESAGGRPFVLQDKLPDLHLAQERRLEAATLVLVSGFGADEPILEVLEAARSLPDGWQLLITGNSKRFLETRLNGCKVPDNVSFCGFLSEEDYQSTLRSADLLMVLTKNDHTLTCGAYEAVALGKPSVLSNTEAIRGYFTKGAEYCDPSPESISGACLRAIENREQLAQQSVLLRSELQRSWPRTFAGLIEYVSGLSGTA